MSTRFFVDDPITGREVRLIGAEARHVVKVMRARVGDQVTLFDGGGDEFGARIVRIDADAVSLAVLARRREDLELTFDLTLGVALPKGARQGWLVEKAVELGVRRLVPLAARRSVAQPVDRAVARLRRAVIEASKQCGRNRLMDIACRQSLAAFGASAPPDALRLVAHFGPHAVPIAHLGTPPVARSVYVAVGPEGGFADDELESLGGRWHAVHLGPRTLRTETAAVAVAAFLATGWSAVTEP